MDAGRFRAGGGARRAHRALVLAAALAFLWPVVFNGFVSIDDDVYITDNAMVRQGLTWEGVRWAFGTFHAGNWHPLSWVSHMADVTAFGLAPRGHHAVGLALHSVNALLLQQALWECAGGLWAGTAAALLFALHPLRVESFAWAAERKDLLAGLFWMLTLLAYRRHAARPGGRRLAAVVALYALGLAAKPMLVSLPLVLLALDRWPLGRLRGGHPADLAPLVREKVPLLALAAASSAVTLLAQGAAQASASFPAGVRLANAALSAVGYVGKTLWPAGLAVYYPFRWESPAWQGAVAAGALLAATGLVASQRVARPWLWTGWLWYLLALVPVIGLVQVGEQAMADRYTYLPGIGLVVAAVWGLAGVAGRTPSARRATGLGIACLAGALGALSMRQAGFWSDSERLFTRALEVTSGNWLAHDHLGVLRASQGRDAEAREHCLEAARLNPFWAPPRNNLGNILLRQGRPAEAVEEYRVALLIEPGNPVARYNLGIALSQLGRYAEARQALEHAAAAAPLDPRTHTNLGVLKLREGDRAGALTSFREAARLDPGSADARYNLGIALERAGDLEGAREEFRRALTIAPRHEAAARALSRVGDGR